MSLTRLSGLRCHVHGLHRTQPLAREAGSRGAQTRQRRRHQPNHHYTDYPILSTSGGYMLQMLWYTTNSFNNDTRYQELFHNHWLADESFYKQAL